MPYTQAILRPDPKPNAPFRLFTFHPAGFGASFYSPWAKLLPNSIELCSVQSPGRENRFREKPLSRMEDLLDQLERDLTPELSRPFVFFGHSMGAWVAFSLAQRLWVRGVLPQAVFLSGRQPPHIPDHLRPLHTLPDGEFVQELQRRYDSIPQAIAADPDLMAIFLPTIRADVTLLETYALARPAPIPVPITVIAGDQDHTSRPDDLDCWRSYTTKDFSRRRFAGGHFYLQEQREALVAIVEAQIIGLQP